jgi:hypothetical protein
MMCYLLSGLLLTTASFFSVASISLMRSEFYPVHYVRVGITGISQTGVVRASQIK